MAKLGGLPDGLANQLAGAAAKGAAPAGGDKASAKEGKGWVVPTLGKFELDAALDKAYGRAAGYLNFMLSPEGLVIELQQGDAQTTAEVREVRGDRLYRSYTGQDMLKLYASQHGGKGVVADGQV
ncbi:MAG: hypothetical protein H6922_02780 [Pseudomonadaceae bacterium]|nr:hypothetical protein [Pseudomonadaceae bacterium]